MPYDRDVLERDLIAEWDDDDFYLFRYAPKSSGNANETTRFVLDFKNGNPDGIQVATEYAIQLFNDKLEQNCIERKCEWILTIPSSRANRPNSAGEILTRHLAKEFDWLLHLPNSLVRIETVQKSAWARPGERPGYDEHLRTIEYQGTTINGKGKCLMMFDDVITRKVTSRACRDILLDATRCDAVIGIYLGRTW